MDLAELKKALTDIQRQRDQVNLIVDKVTVNKGYISHTVTGNDLLKLKELEVPGTSSEVLIKHIEKLIKDAKKPPVAKVAKAKAVK